MAQRRPGAAEKERAFAQEVLLQTLRAAFESECAALGEDSLTRLSDLVGPAIDPRTFWDLARDGLADGGLALVFVAGPRSPELQPVADFLNREMHPNGVAPSLGATSGGPPTLDPLADLALQLRVWDERSFFQALMDNRGPDEAAIADAILAWARDRGLAIQWDGDETRGSFTPWLEVHGERFAPATFSTDGVIVLDTAGLRGGAVFENEPMSTLLEDQLGKIGSLSDDGTGLDLSHLLAEPSSFEGLLAVLDWIVDAILATR